MSTEQVYASPAVQSLAQTLGVDLAKVSGNGAGGRVTLDDVRAAATARGRQVTRPTARSQLAARASAPKLQLKIQSQWTQLVAMGGGYMRQQKTVDIDVFARNPLVDELRAAAPENYAAARNAVGEPPTLFTAGDLPLFTTAGFDPAQLLHLPWIARPAAARASGTEASAIFERYGAPTLECWGAAEWAYANDDGVRAYRQRVDAFAQAGANAMRRVES